MFKWALTIDNLTYYAFHSSIVFIFKWIWYTCARIWRYEAVHMCTSLLVFVLCVKLHTSKYVCAPSQCSVCVWLFVCFECLTPHMKICVLNITKQCVLQMSSFTHENFLIYFHQSVMFAWLYVFHIMALRRCIFDSTAS